MNLSEERHRSDGVEDLSECCVTKEHGIVSCVRAGSEHVTFCATRAYRVLR